MRMLTKLGFRSMSLLVRTKIDAMLPGHKQNYYHASRVMCHVSRTQDAHSADGGQDDALRPPVHQGGDGLGVKVEVWVRSQ